MISYSQELFRKLNISGNHRGGNRNLKTVNILMELNGKRAAVELDNIVHGFSTEAVEVMVILLTGAPGIRQAAIEKVHDFNFYCSLCPDDGYADDPFFRVIQLAHCLNGVAECVVEQGVKVPGDRKSVV